MLCNSVQHFFSLIFDDRKLSRDYCDNEEGECQAEIMRESPKNLGRMMNLFIIFFPVCLSDWNGRVYNADKLSRIVPLFSRMLHKIKTQAQRLISPPSEFKNK